MNLNERANRYLGEVMVGDYVDVKDPTLASDIGDELRTVAYDHIYNGQSLQDIIDFLVSHGVRKEDIRTDQITNALYQTLQNELSRYGKMMVANQKDDMDMDMDMETEVEPGEEI